MTLTVRNVLLTMTTIYQSKYNVTYIPFIIRLVLQQLQQQNVTSIMQYCSSSQHQFNSAPKRLSYVNCGCQ